jgi:asparagine synthase (glutamine-hydrolysing)
MCGIAGIIRLDQQAVDPGVLATMTDALVHRGPEARGTFIDRNVGLGHRRLKILDLSDAAAQPMISDDGNTALVFNGEIYNFQELREFLAKQGIACASTGDTEVLMHLYRMEGERCLDRLRGMFAFAAYDRQKRTVFLARDRVGKKPIKYFTDGKTFAFASELKALRTLSSCPRGIDQEAVHHFLTMMYVPSPATGIVGIRKLPHASSIMIHAAEGVVGPIRKYWSLRYEPDDHVTVSEWKERILAAVDESVKLRMIADVPVGAFLSGGVDSAAVVAFMARHSPHPVKTFSIGSPEETHNELPFAALTAKHIGTEHHPMVLTADIVRLLPELVRMYEEPYADPSAIPTYLIARETKKHVTVALNGDGGDENFLGYVRYPILRFSLLWEKFPGLLHSAVRAGVELSHQMLRTTLTYRALRFQSTIRDAWPERYLQYISFFTEEEKRNLYAQGFGASYPSTASWYASSTASARDRARDPFHQALAMDIDTYLADDLIPKVDLGSMAHALETRSPLLDHRLLELTAKIPLRYTLRGLQKKWIFKQALEGIVPSEVLHKKKTGFRLPLDRWFRTDLQGFVSERLLDSSSCLLRFLRREALEQFFRGYLSSRVDYSDHLWALLWLEEWLRQYT